MTSSQSLAVNCWQPAGSSTPLQFGWVVFVLDVVVTVVTVVVVLVVSVVVDSVVVVVAVMVVVLVIEVPVYVVLEPVRVVLVAVLVVPVPVAVVAVAVVDVVVVVVAVVVENVWVEVVHVSHRPGQLLAAASRMTWISFSQFLRRKPGAKQPIGSGTPLHDGSEHVLHVTGHWMRAASAGFPSALHSDCSKKQESGSGSPLQLGVVVVADVVVTVVVVDDAEVVVEDAVVVVDDAVVVVVELTQLLHSAGHADLSWVATATTGV